MKRHVVGCLFLLFFSQIATPQEVLMRIASSYIPHVTWRANSLVTGDFTCHGKIQLAILGTTPTEIVVAVFLHGANEKPGELRFRDFQRMSTKLKTETLNYKPDRQLPGFHRSRVCKGLTVKDG